MRPSHLRPRLLAFTTALLMGAPPALADWEARATTKTTPPPGQTQTLPEMKAKMYGRKGLLRVDTKMPMQNSSQAHGATMDMSMLFDFEKRTGVTLMHAQKIASMRNLDDMPMGLPAACSGAALDIDACLSQQGFKKVGSEKVNDHPTTVYEGDVPGPNGTKQHLKLWRPNDLKEVPYVRARTSNSKGYTMDIDLTNVEVGSQPDALFDIPVDYRQVAVPAPSSMPGGLKAEDFQGKSPAEIQELIRQRMGQGAPPATSKKP